MQQQFTYTDGFEFLRCGWDSASGQIGHVELNRPASSNAFNTQLWEEFPKVCEVGGGVQKCSAGAYMHIRGDSNIAQLQDACGKDSSKGACNLGFSGRAAGLQGCVSALCEYCQQVEQHQHQQQ